jgi:transcriptional regulator with XRE-family HTH domain
MNKISTFGGTIRDLRIANKLPIRKVAAFLDIDPATLSKIERDERSANRNIIIKLADFFNTDYKELLVIFLSHKVACDLVKEECSDKVLQAAEQRLAFYKTKDLKGS